MKECKNCEPCVDKELYGYDWHQHEFRFACHCGYYYIPMRRAWHDMSESEKSEELKWAHEQKAIICEKCGKERMLI